MKTIRLFAVIATFLMLVCSCNREEMSSDRNEEFTESPITFKARLAPIGTKSHFGENEDNDGTLYWDNSDNVLVASVLQFGSNSEFSEKINEHLHEISAGHGGNYEYIGADIEKYIHTTLTSPVIGPDGTTADLRGTVTAKQLLPERNEVEDAYYEFIAIYPVHSVQPLKMLFWAGDAQTGDGCVGYPVNIPHEQNGKSYGSYHICFDSGLDFNAQNAGCYRASDVVDGNVTISFDNIQPATAMLRFDIKTDSDTPKNISKLVISLSGGCLSGDAYISAWENMWMVPNFYEKDSEVYNDVVLKFKSPVAVSSTATDKFYAVVHPSFAAPEWGAPAVANQYTNSTVRFFAYDENDNLVFQATKITPEYGFQPGQRYDFTLNMTAIVPPEEALSGQFSLSASTKAFIAKGNLQAYIANGTRDISQGNNGWRIADHQYDVVGLANYENFDSYTGLIDLFGFSTVKNDHGIPVIDGDKDNTDYSGDAAGWTDCMSSSGWRTITADEGVYLFTERTNADQLFAFATILVGAGETPVKGLVFLPDQYNLPAGCNFSPVKYSGYDFTINNYNADGASSGSSGSWEAMEAEGAVFWPIAGCRSGLSLLPNGAYWSGSDDEDRPDEACMLEFTDLNGGHFSPDHFPRYYGACVRLVRDVTE